jgi:chitosanase
MRSDLINGHLTKLETFDHYLSESFVREEEMISETQKRTAEAIVNIFETGSALGDYSNVTVVAGDPGHLTYGRSQTTLASGNLFLLLQAYVEAPGAEFGDSIRPFLPRVQAVDLSLDNNGPLRSLLQQAGGDPVMRAVQDNFFDRVYWAPAQTAAQALGINSALGCCVVYDSTVHGSFKLIRDRTTARIGQIGAGGVTERAWVTGYVSIRRDWLANHPNPLLRRTVYRMDALQRVVDASNWDLVLPLTVRGVLIDDSVLDGHPVRASAQSIEERILRLANPMMRGDDVSEVQRALAGELPGVELEVDGVFGRDTDKAVRDYQTRQGLKSDGIVGPSTRAALHL